MIKLITIFFALIFCAFCGNVLAEPAQYVHWKYFDGFTNPANDFATAAEACVYSIGDDHVNPTTFISVEIDELAFGNCTFNSVLGGVVKIHHSVGSLPTCADGSQPILTTSPASCASPIPPDPPDDPSCTPEPGNPDSCHYNPGTAPVDKNLGAPCTGCPCNDSPENGNPINHGNGNKRQSELDYLSAANGGLQLRRTYNSNSTRNGRYGTHWSSNYEKMIWTNSAYPNNIGSQRDDGKILTFTLADGKYQPDADIADSLTRQTDSAGNTSGWQYLVAADQSLESYDANGKLLSITSRAGWAQTLKYSTGPSASAQQAGLLLSISDHAGRSLTFEYDHSNRVVRMNDVTGSLRVDYTYDSSNRLSTVTYRLLDWFQYQMGETRTYVYNEPAYTSGADLLAALTGIIDENGARFATFNYDSSGKAISTEHAGGVEKYDIAYTQAGSESTVTDPLGTVRSYTYKMLANTIKNTGQSQPGGAGCGAASSVVTYDANGNVATRTDFNGNVTTYVYDVTRNLETSRIEASGTPQARIISTQWHASFRLPTKITEPNRITSVTYDAVGNVLTKTVQATTDATGAQGLTPTVIGTAQILTYTYNAFGQILTAADSLKHTTTYSYYPSTDTAAIIPNYRIGDLATITNAAGQVTTFTQYDGDGRPLAFIDANGITSALTYNPRGWLTGRSVTSSGIAESTSYDYDGVGQLIKVTMPDASTVNYAYDPAHRLTSITDSLGNSITYRLDNMGNRVQEQAKGSSGTLARQTNRVVDALNRLQQVTGAVQ